MVHIQLVPNPSTRPWHFGLVNMNNYLNPLNSISYHLRRQRHLVESSQVLMDPIFAGQSGSPRPPNKSKMSSLCLYVKFRVQVKRMFTMFKSNQTSWGAVDMLASDKYEKLCPLKLVHPNFEKIVDLARYNNQDGKCVQLKMPKSIACWFFLNFSSKSKRCFFSQGKFQAYYCWFVCPNTEGWGWNLQKLFEPLKSSKVSY